MLKKVTITTLLLMLLIVGCGKSVDTEEKLEFQGAREVKVESADLTDISSYIEYSGKVLTDQAINIKPAMGGKVMEYKVLEGSVVNKGDLLVVLDDTQLKQAQIQYEIMEKNYNRMQELSKTGAIDDATFDEVEAGYKVAKSGYEFMLKNTYVRAPINGIITMRYRKEGEHFDAMMDPLLLRMVNLEKVKATIQVSDADIKSIEKGQEVLLMINNSDVEFTGEISFVSPEADIMAGTFAVEIMVNNQENLLHNNQFVKVKVLTKTSKKTIVVPQHAVINDKYVFILENNIAVKKFVTLGLENEYEIEIIDGIEAGVEVVTVGNAGLSENDKVKIRD
ncbi:MAG: efflux RND transporter periplasmic adaptor subunit [Candidatus Tenebribacter mawsonii]|nr:efflux RND transporter periplasmic adaptor subunit [Candidatus Tenebribacter mawsonii]